MLSKKEDEIARLRSGSQRPTAPAIAPPSPATDGAAAPVTLRPPEADAPPSVSLPTTPPSATAVRSHVIQQGDNLWKIARQYYPTDINGGIEKIKQANPVQTSNDRNLKIGDSLVIP
ncbi:MAG: LysM peptidoglycan-binding domain-containing protein [Bdellovibrionaceae bacterium]|nr:LysM peptidoglycan-binding domain-containing protein [Pseudobdellovibrionaceae bacterium]